VEEGGERMKMPANVDYIFSVLLKKEIARKSDEIAERVEKIVDEHFPVQAKEKLDKAQISRFTGIAYAGDTKKDLERFIQKQAGRGKEAWTAKRLNEYLLDEIRDIVKKDSTNVYNEAITKVKETVDSDVANKFDSENSKELIHNTAVELLRKFATHFGIYYLYKAEAGG
jgi:hypothetical protein